MRRTARPGRPRRGFTLLEVVIALVLMLALASIVMPAVWGQSDDVKAREGADQLQAALVMARAEAQRTQGMVEVTAETGRGGTALVLREWGSETEDARSADAAPAAELARMELPASVEIKRVGAAPGAGPTGSAVAVARCVPDGRVMAASGLKVGAGAVVMAIEVNPWTGRVSAAREAAPEPAGRSAASGATADADGVEEDRP